MMFGKAAQIATALVKLTTMSEWEDVLDRTPIEHLESVMVLIRELTTHNLAQFHMRVMSQLSIDKLGLLLLAKTDPTTADEGRRRLCLELLSTSDNSLNVTALKIKTLFKTELEQAVADGGKCVATICPNSDIMLLVERRRARN